MTAPEPSALEAARRSTLSRSGLSGSSLSGSTASRSVAFTLPVRALLALLGLSIWVGRGVSVGVLNLQPVEIASGLFLFAYAAQLALSSSRGITALGPPTRRLLTGLIVACALLIAAAVVSLAAALDPISVLRFCGRYLVAILLLTVLSRFLDRRSRLQTLERYLLIGAVISVGVAVAGFFVSQLGALTIRYGDRAQALLNHPNQLAMLLTALVPIALVNALKRPARVGPWLVLVVIAAGIALTGSKANLLLLVVVVPLTTFLALEPIRRLARRMALALGLGVAMAAIGLVAVLTVSQFNPRTLTTLERLFTDPATTSTVATRSDLWRTAFEIGLEHPWTGVGADNTVYYLPFSHAHNVVFEYFLTLGLPGLMALLMLLFFTAVVALACIRSALRRPGPAYPERLSLIGYALACLAYVGSNMSSDSFGGTTLPMLWILLAASLARLDLALETAAGTGGREA